MPKSYSDDEKQITKEKLMFCAAECMALYGIKRTTVDELVKRTKIPKGTFYLFYPSKEALLFEVILKLHDEIQNNFMESIKNLNGIITADTLAECIFNSYKQIEHTNLANIFISGEMEVLIRKLPPEIAAEHFAHDEDSIKKLISFIPSADTNDTEIYSTALRGALLLVLYRNEIGSGFDDALKLILRGITLQLLGGNNND